MFYLNIYDTIYHCMSSSFTDRLLSPPLFITLFIGLFTSLILRPICFKSNDGTISSLYTGAALTCSWKMFFVKNIAFSKLQCNTELTLPGDSYASEQTCSRSNMQGSNFTFVPGDTTFNTERELLEIKSVFISLHLFEIENYKNVLLKQCLKMFWKVKP